MRKSLSLLVVILGIAIGAGAGGFVSVKELPALPAASSSVTALDQNDFNEIVLITNAPDLEIPQCATVPEVSFAVPQICAGFTADLEKPPGVPSLQWQATYNKKLLPWDDILEVEPGFVSNYMATLGGSCNYRNPRDAI